MQSDEMFENFNVDDFNNYLLEFEGECRKEIEETPDYQGEFDILLATIANLKEGLKGVREIEELEMRKQARIFADMSFLMGMIRQMEGDEDNDYFEDEDEELNELDEFDEEYEHR